MCGNGYGCGLVGVVGCGISSCGIGCVGGGFVAGDQKSTHHTSVRQFDFRVGLFRNIVRSDATKLSLPSSFH